MAIDFEAEGLFEGVEGDEARAARHSLLERLVGEGFTLDELKQACKENRLALLPAERILAGAGGERISANEVAARSGIERELLDAIWRALGLALEEPDAPAFTDEDVEAARSLATFREAGLPDEALIEIARVLGRGMSDLVATLDLTLSRLLNQPGDNEYELAMLWAQSLEQLAPRFDPVVLHVLAVHRRDRIRHAVVNATEQPARLAGARPISICFADLVGFTRLGEEVPPDELTAVARRLDELAGDVAAPPVRLVKTIGDAAMLAATDADALLVAALDLVEAADAEGASFPQLRAGLATGEAVPRGADWYGRPVNLASRLTGFARPGSVVADGALHESAAGDYAWTRIGRRRFKGLRGEVEVFRVRRPREER